MRATFLCALLALTPAHLAQAETPLTATEFDAYTQGKTIFFSSQGEAYGVEQYLSNRRVRWAFIDDTCRIGHWYSDAANICFVYKQDATPQCWEFYLTNGKLRALFTSNLPATELFETGQTTQPLACTGPDVGV
ncbi:hypothetical protein SAMN05216227_100228 [Pseudorhodobacter antarcticus]|jgi:hypothetical protein|uniref:Protease inhibitor Inh n=1 Tax=Pseudorhodobacter antarcticus TaxID=1077947 RepID=A0A1H8AYL8_9RHOB|nr:hypothetical protein [Pseudorhodobacter antarcticus]SEM74969.1 hypothetical protein SAMN05216227_100228 [Pseudorhodobacter antarcticus]